MATAKRNQRRPPWVKPFLAAFRDTGIVRAACQAADINRQNVYKYRDRHPEFAEQWAQADADAADALEAVALQRARKSKMDGGSDALLIFLLKARRPEKFRENINVKAQVEVEVSYSDLAREAEAYLQGTDDAKSAAGAALNGSGNGRAG
jgi:hypothetical protein|tara:strand:- start:170 stop:619 length:450 start_codon:yes stop_codon:yes gene_type:complete